MDKTKEDLMRALILDRGERLFTVGGYHKTSMDQIAAASGISKPTLYKYFENKYELFSTLFFASRKSTSREYGRCSHRINPNRRFWKIWSGLFFISPMSGAAFS